MPLFKKTNFSAHKQKQLAVIEELAGLKPEERYFLSVRAPLAILYDAELLKKVKKDINRRRDSLKEEPGFTRCFEAKRNEFQTSYEQASIDLDEIQAIQTAAQMIDKTDSDYVNQIITEFRLCNVSRIENAMNFENVPKYQEILNEREWLDSQRELIKQLTLCVRNKDMTILTDFLQNKDEGTREYLKEQMGAHPSFRDIKNFRDRVFAEYQIKRTEFLDEIFPRFIFRTERERLIEKLSVWIRNNDLEQMQAFTVEASEEIKKYFTSDSLLDNIKKYRDSLLVDYQTKLPDNDTEQFIYRIKAEEQIQIEYSDRLFAEYKDKFSVIHEGTPSLNMVAQEFVNQIETEKLIQQLSEWIKRDDVQAMHNMVDEMDEEKKQRFFPKNESLSFNVKRYRDYLLDEYQMEGKYAKQFVARIKEEQIQEGASVSKDKRAKRSSAEMPIETTAHKKQILEKIIARKKEEMESKLQQLGSFKKVISAYGDIESEMENRLTKVESTFSEQQNFALLFVGGERKLQQDIDEKKEKEVGNELVEQEAGKGKEKEREKEREKEGPQSRLERDDHELLNELDDLKKLNEWSGAMEFSKMQQTNIMKVDEKKIVDLTNKFYAIDPSTREMIVATLPEDKRNLMTYCFNRSMYLNEEGEAPALDPLVAFSMLREIEADFVQLKKGESTIKSITHFQPFNRSDKKVQAKTALLKLQYLRVLEVLAKQTEGNEQSEQNVITLFNNARQSPLINEHMGHYWIQRWGKTRSRHMVDRIYHAPRGPKT